jgi:hypothetical protein
MKKMTRSCSVVVVALLALALCQPAALAGRVLLQDDPADIDVEPVELEVTELPIGNSTFGLALDEWGCDLGVADAWETCSLEDDGSDPAILPLCAWSVRSCRAQAT